MKLIIPKLYEFIHNYHISTSNYFVVFELTKIFTNISIWNLTFLKSNNAIIKSEQRYYTKNQLLYRTLIAD